MRFQIVIHPTSIVVTDDAYILGEMEAESQDEVVDFLETGFIPDEYDFNIIPMKAHRRQATPGILRGDITNMSDQELGTLAHMIIEQRLQG